MHHCCDSESVVQQAFQHQLLDCKRFLIVSDFAENALGLVGLVDDFVSFNGVRWSVLHLLNFVSRVFL